MSYDVNLIKYVIKLVGFGGLWGMLAVGLFAEKDLLEGFSSYAGLFHGGGFYLLGVQLLASICCIAWSSIVTFILIKVIKIRIILHAKTIISFV